MELLISWDGDSETISLAIFRILVGILQGPKLLLKSSEHIKSVISSALVGFLGLVFSGNQVFLVGGIFFWNCSYFPQNVFDSKFVCLFLIIQLFYLYIYYHWGFYTSCYPCYIGNTFVGPTHCCFRYTKIIYNKEIIACHIWEAGHLAD